MPSWKKVIVSGSNASLLSLTTSGNNSTTNLITAQQSNANTFITADASGDQYIGGFRAINNLDDDLSIFSHGDNRSTTRYGINMSGFGEIFAQNMTNGLVIGVGTAHRPIIFGSNGREVLRIQGGPPDGPEIISGSAVSTGSFGHLLVNGSTVGSSPNATDGSQTTISGSSTSTGSFGHVMQDGKGLPPQFTTGSSIFIGENAGASDDGSDNRNIGIGKNALDAATTGHLNIAIGDDALTDVTTGNHNVAIGFESQKDTTGGNNTSVGYNSLEFNTSGNNNVAIGYAAAGGFTYSGADNIAIGFSALGGNDVSGDFNIAIGKQALNSNTTADDNLAIGDFALNSVGTDANSSRNLAIGSEALRYVVYTAGSSGFNNTALGWNAGKRFGDNAGNLTSASYGVYIGHTTYPLENNSYNEILIGSQVRGKGSNTATIGDGNITDIYLSQDQGATVHTGNVSGSSTSTGSFGKLLGDGSDLTGVTSDVVDDTSPQLGGNLDLNSNDITGTGNIDITGNITAQNFIVSSSVTSITYQSLSGSTIFGDTEDDTHQFTGSLLVTGSNIEMHSDADTKLRIRRNQHSTSALELSYRGSTGPLIHSVGKELDISTDTSGISLLPSSGIISINDNSTQTVKPGALSIQKISGINYLAIASGAGSSAEGDIFLITGSNGNVGIANKDPQEKLDVTGNIQASGNISGSSTSTGSFGKLEVGGQIRLIEGSDSFIKGGDLGIGTNTPVARLEIEDDGTSNAMLLKLTQDDTNVYGMVIGNDSFSTSDTDGGQHILSNDGNYIVRNLGTGASARFGAGISFSNYNYLQITGSIAEFTTTKISGSSTSTGSFGHLLVNGSAVGGSSPDATDGSQSVISGSSTSTGSFGRVETVGDLIVAFPGGSATGFQVDTSVERHTELKLNNRTIFVNDDIIAIGEDTAQNDIAHQKGGGAGGRASVYIGNEAGENVDNSGGGAANNTFIGDKAGQDVTSGTANTFVGAGAGSSVTTGNNNVIIGRSSNGETDIDSNIIIGQSAGKKVGANGTNADHNIIFGNGTVSQKGGNVDHNILMGYRTSKELGDAQGSYNVHLGYEAASNVVTASYNVAIGYQAMEDAGGASSGGNHVTKNVAIGYRPLVKIDKTAQHNIAIGVEAASNNTSGSNNIVMGYRAAYFNSGDLGENNIFMGTSTGNAIDGGELNVCLGKNAGAALTTANDNILIGQGAGFEQTTGNHIIALGKNAGRGSGVTADTNASSIFIGQAAYSGESGATNETVIGTSAIGKGSNTVVLGDDNVTDIYLSEDSGATVHGGLFSGSFYQEFLHNFQDDLDTTGHFVPWVGNAESTGNNNANTAYMSPYDMTLQRIIIRPETLSSTDTFNVIIVKQDDGDTTNDTVATATSAGNHADNTAIVINQSDFNATPSVGALDKVSIKILPASDLSGTIDWYITSIWKVDKIL